MDLALPEPLVPWGWVTHVMSDNLRWPLQYVTSMSNFFLLGDYMFFGDPAIFVSLSHRAACGTGSSMCVCELEQSEIGKPKAECIFPWTA